MGDVELKTYGKMQISKDGKSVWLRFVPHVAMRFKRVFTKVNKGAVGSLNLSMTPENCRDLEWFLERYPVEGEGIKEITQLASKHREKMDLVDKFLSAQQAPIAFELECEKREYQMVAASLVLTTGNLLLADDVGLGKTITAFMMISDPRTRPAVYVTLTHLPIQVKTMLAKFAPWLSVHVVNKGQPYDLTRFRRRTVPYPDVVILSYSKLAGWADTLSKTSRSVIYDEVQELRHGDSNRYRAAKLITDSVQYRMGMSATPIYNYGGEIFNVMEAIAPGALGTSTEFFTEWCSFGGSSDKSTIHSPSEFGAYMREAGLMLRRTRKEVGRELPPCYSDVQHVDADLYALEQVSKTCAELAEMLLKAGGMGLDKMRAAEEFDWRLRQATGIAKAPYVAEFVRLLVEAGEKVVLYGWHHAVYAIWQDKFKDIPVVMYTGQESIPQKEEAKRKFISGEAQVLIMSLRSGAGLDGLQGTCNMVVFGELDWSPGVHEQNIGRVWRDGQENAVNVYFMVCDEGSDPFMVEVNGVKEQQIKGIRDPNAELVEKLQLDPGRIKNLARRYLEKHSAKCVAGTPLFNQEEVACLQPKKR
jgi:SNF2 family DNA or RNA helicase